MRRCLKYFVFVGALLFFACESPAREDVAGQSTFPSTLSAGDTLIAVDGEIVLLDSAFAIYGIRPLLSPHFILDPGVIENFQEDGPFITFSAVVERDPPGVKSFGIPIRIFEIEYFSEE